MNKAISIENLSVKYLEDPVLNDVSFDVYEGDFLGIIGPNGGGKTTLLKAIIGLVPAYKGNVCLYGKDAKEQKKLIGYVPQVAELDKKFPITVREAVLTGMITPKLKPLYKYSEGEKAKADELLNRVGILELGDRMISQLSGGEFQKMLIARALAVNPKLLLLDEPTAGVDVKSRDQIFDLLSELNSAMTIILVTHDMTAISSYVKNLACLNTELIYHGETELNEEIVEALYGCPVDLIAHGVPHRVLKEHEGGK